MYLGIDIGSTGSKAVLIDENEKIIARGITHSGSNVRESLERVKEEVMNNAKIVKLCEYLPEYQKEKLEWYFRYYQFREKLDLLKIKYFGILEKKDLSIIATNIFQRIEDNFLAKYKESAHPGTLLFFSDFIKSLFSLYVEDETYNLEDLAAPLRSNFNKILDNEVEKQPWKTDFAIAMELHK